MNEQNKNNVIAHLDLTKWLLEKSDDKFPEEIHKELPQYKNLARIFKRSFEICLLNDLHDNVINALLIQWEPYHKTLIGLKSLNENKPTMNMTQLKGQLTNIITTLNNTPANNTSNPFHIIVSYINSFTNETELKRKLDESQETFNELNQEISDLLTILQKKSGEIGIEKFAEIFGNQSIEHSRFAIKLDDEKGFLNYFKLGSSQIWLIIAIATLFLGPIWIIENPTIEVTTNLNLLIFFIGKKLFLISIWIFFVRFSFRNYSNHKYLSIQNKHRQNVLNSFKLLLHSLPNDDSASRSSLIESVSKSIYGNDKNPFQINNKNDYDLQGLLEILKIFRV